MSCYFVHHVGTSVYDNIITYVLTGYTDLLDIMPSTLSSVQSQCAVYTVVQLTYKAQLIFIVTFL